MQQKPLTLLFLFMFWMAGSRLCHADLREVLASGVLRHLGAPHARFVTDNGGGFDVELLRLFSKHLGVSYQYVETTWDRFIPDLTGCEPLLDAEGRESCSNTPVSILGDVVAHGLTILPRYKERILISTPVFPTQIWIMARKDVPIRPVNPTGSIHKDIASVKALLQGRTLLGKARGCLDPALYGLLGNDVQAGYFSGNHQDMARAVIAGQAELMLIDVPDALLALERWPHKLKVIGPISERQDMCYAFALGSSRLMEAFNVFLEECRADGTLYRLAHRYFPGVLHYFPDFPWFPRSSSLFLHGDFSCLRQAV